jgi:hypothetical protein
MRPEHPALGVSLSCRLARAQTEAERQDDQQERPKKHS